MIQRIYFDTSVVGGCFDDEFKKPSLLLFEEICKGDKIAVISDILLDEISFARKEVREYLNTLPDAIKEYIVSTDESEELAEKYISEGAVSKKFYEDALHIAVATIYKVDVLASWNFKHIVNLERIRKHNSVNLKNGYSLLEIRNPREIVSEDV